MLRFQIFRFSIPMAALVFAAGACRAQEASHWGVQGDYSEGKLPQQVVDQFKDLVEKPEIRSKTYNAGIVRFHENGAPSWAVEFSKTQLTIAGSRLFASSAVVGGFGSAEVRGSGTVRGVMATKYLNFFSTRHISGGLAMGGGIGKLNANYYRYTNPPGPSIITGREAIDYTVPMFQILAQVDVRPVRWVSLSPFYGIRNGTLGFGGAIRIHFVR